MRMALMTVVLGTSLLCLALLGLAGQGAAPTTQNKEETQSDDSSSKGINPRPAAADYASHVELKGFEIGATMLTSKEISQAFTADLSSCCLVLEVAIYPSKGEEAEVASKDFILSVAGTKITIPASSPAILVAGLKTSSREGDLRPHGSVGVTYGPATYDPSMGQPAGGHKVDTSGQVSVGQHPSDSYPTDLDRELWELELKKKGLPEGKLSAPIAGYLYFVRAKKKKNTTWQLDATLGSQKTTLDLR